MLTDFAFVPDWFGTDNVDGGVAVGDLHGNGSTDLVVFMIDAPAGPNGGFYRVGRRFVDGAVTGGWGPWQRVPDWPFWENPGGGIALADLGGGSLDLVLFVVDAPVGPNIGLVRVARGPRRRRDAHGRLGPVADGARLAVLGEPGGGLCRRRRRRRRFARAGAARRRQPGRTERWPVPDRRARLRRDGERLEFVGVGTGLVPLRERRGGARGGRPRRRRDARAARPDGRLGRRQERRLLQRRLASGRPRPPSRWVGAVAEGARLGLPREPGGRNHRGRPRRRRPPRPGRARRGQPGRAERGPGPGRAVETDLATAAEEGVWRILEMDSGVLAVHAALLPTGDVLFFAGSSNNPDAAAAQRYGTRVWHYPAPAMSAPDTPVDLFCCGHAHLPDGRLAAGGTERYDPFVGLKQCVVFDPAAGPLSPASPTGRAGRWTSQPAMGQGRWYPTLVALPGGEVRAAASSASPRARCGSRDGESPRPFRRGSPGRNAPSLRRGGPRPPGRGRQPS